MFDAFTSGFVLGFSLILAIGAQNAFVLRQGLKREHVFLVCLACALSDAILIAAGVTGSGALANRLPLFAPLMQFGGAAFLLAYGALSFRRAWRGASALRVADTGKGSAKTALLTVLGFTWLNPHVYLDTVVLVGSVAAQSPDRRAFGTGAISASFVFFFGLGYGARLLAPLFARAAAWRVLDGLIGLVMWAIAGKLLVM